MISKIGVWLSLDWGQRVPRARSGGFDLRPGRRSRDSLVGMVRKVETIITLTDDLDGTRADRTMMFAVDGTTYEIDLSKRNAAAFQKVLAPYLDAARKVKQPRGRRGATNSSGR